MEKRPLLKVFSRFLRVDPASALVGHAEKISLHKYIKKVDIYQDIKLPSFEFCLLKFKKGFADIALAVFSDFGDDQACERLVFYLNLLKEGI